VADRVGEAAVAVTPDHELVRGLLRRGARELCVGLGALEGGVAGTARAPAVEGAAARHHRDVRAERAASCVVRARPQPELHEHVLDDVLGRRLVAKHAVGGRDCLRCELAVGVIELARVLEVRRHGLPLCGGFLKQLVEDHIALWRKT
jgi:hypothetical protein